MIKRLFNGLRRRQHTPVSGEATVAGVETARELFGPLTAKRQLGVAAIARVGPRLERQFRRYVGWLDRQGYDFASCEGLPPRLDRRRVHLRYDVHVRDLFGAFALAGLHEELQIPGSFQICWEHSRPEIALSDIFRKLQAFDSRFVEFGLHCSPESRWIVADRFDGRGDLLEEWINRGEARRMMTDWLAAFRRDGEDAAILREALGRAETGLAELTDSFRRDFGGVTTISGHGTPLSAAYLDAVGEEPGLSALAAYLHPVDFLAPERIHRFGFAVELTQFDEDGLPGQRLMFESPIEDMASRYRQRMEAGGGFVVLLHPASWTGDYFAPFLDRVTAPDWPDKQGAASAAALPRPASVRTSAT